MSKQSDLDLFRNAQQGDQTALEQLLLARYDRLLRLISSKLPASLQAKIDPEDVLQQTYVEAFRDFSKLAQSSFTTLDSWLSSIAEHRLLDAIKSARRKKRGGDFQQVHNHNHAPESSVADLLDMLSDGLESPSKLVAGAEGVKVLQIQLASLRDEYREVIQMRHLEGKSLEEIADLQGQSVDQVRGLLYRARKKLRDGMGRSSLYFSKD